MVPVSHFPMSLRWDQEETPGVWFESGTGHRVEKLFSLSLDLWGEGGGLVTLSTYSDAWLALDYAIAHRPQCTRRTRHALQRSYGGCPRFSEARSIPVIPPGMPTPRPRVLKTCPKRVPATTTRGGRSKPRRDGRS